MPGLLTEPDFKHITVTPLHPTFIAEIQGVDFSKAIEPEVFIEIHAALAKVYFTSCHNLSPYLFHGFYFL